MQKTRIDDIRQGRGNTLSDNELILTVASVQIRSLPFYNGIASAPVKQNWKKDQYHQVAATQVTSLFHITLEHWLTTLADKSYCPIPSW